MARRLRGLIFDLDGTLTAPHAIDFARMRARCGLPTREEDARSILTLVQELVAPQAREQCLRVIEEEEALGLANMTLNHGMENVLTLIRREQLPCAIMTRNNESALHRFWQLCAEGTLTSGNDLGGDHGSGRAAIEGLTWVPQWVHPAFYRDAQCTLTQAVLQNKPHPDPALAVLRAWQARIANDDAEAPDSGPSYTAPPIDPADVLVVGDHVDDLISGRGAGCQTCFLTNVSTPADGEYLEVEVEPDTLQWADYVVHDGHGLARLMHQLRISTRP